MELISVTTALKPFNDFSRIPADVLEKAKNRGSRVHAAIAAHLTGTFLVTPLPPEEVPLFDSLRLWCDEMVSEVIAVEPELKDESFGYCGHPDALIFNKEGRRAVVDWKTPQVESLSWPIQICAYCEMARKSYGEKFWGYAVQPNPAGSIAKSKPYAPTSQHLQVFLSALNCHRWFNQKGGK